MTANKCIAKMQAEGRVFQLLFFNLAIVPTWNFSQNITFEDNEWKNLGERNYLSGTIYFSGTYFPNVIAFRYENKARGT